jgi:hypothetical protein
MEMIPPKSCYAKGRFRSSINAAVSPDRRLLLRFSGGSRECDPQG